MGRGTCGLLAAALCAFAFGCPEAPPPETPRAHAEPDTTWIRSKKLDADVQELVLRAYDVDLAFPFRVRTLSPADDGEVEVEVEETITRVRPAELAAFVRDAHVVAVRCAPPPTSPAPDETWRVKVDRDVRLIHGTQSACWTALALAFDREPSADEWREVEQAGVIAHARDAKTALVWAPVRSIPRIAAMSFVARIDPYDRE